MSFDTSIVVKNVSKEYLIFERPEDRLKQMIIPKLKYVFGLSSRKYYQTFSALHDVSFEVKRGEVVGIVGRNGSGKSTLLQIISGTVLPTVGSVAVSGKVAALLELGAGFNSEFTGRENVLLNGAILGLSRGEIESKFDSIAEFAGIGSFIDQPVKTYSSGMYVRLAFAVATSVDPDILIVDEALSVGDEAFQRKCFARIEDFRAKGGTILLVSHSPQTIVQLCDRSILLDRGEAILSGDPNIVIKQYQRMMNLTGEAAERVREEIRQARHTDKVSKQPSEVLTPSLSKAREHQTSSPAETDADCSWYDEHLVPDSRVAYEEAGAKITNTRVLNEAGERVNNIEFGRSYTIQYQVRFSEAVRSVIFGMRIKTLTGFVLTGVNNESADASQRPNVNAGDELVIETKFICRLLPGTYAVDAGIMGAERFEHRVLDAALFRVVPKRGIASVGLIDLEPVLSFSRRLVEEPQS